MVGLVYVLYHTLPIDRDGLQQVEYGELCICPISYSTHWQRWITTSRIWWALYMSCIILYPLTEMDYNRLNMVSCIYVLYHTLPIDIDELQQVEYGEQCICPVSYSTHWHDGLQQVEYGELCICPILYSTNWQRWIITSRMLWAV